MRLYTAIPTASSVSTDIILYSARATAKIRPKKRSELYANPSAIIMVSTDQINSRQSPVFNKSAYNDYQCLLFRLPLEIREEIYSYIAQSRVLLGPVSVTPLAFLSPIGGSTEQPAVLTTTTGLSCACTRTRCEFSKALRKCYKSHGAHCRPCLLGVHRFPQNLVIL